MIIYRISVQHIQISCTLDRVLAFKVDFSVDFRYPIGQIKKVKRATFQNSPRQRGSKLSNRVHSLKATVIRAAHLLLQYFYASARAVEN